MNHLMWLGWFYTGCLVLAAAPYGAMSLEAAGLSAVLNMIPTYFVRQQRIDPVARMIMALSITAQPMLLIYSVQAGQMQIDMHLYFLVSIALILVLCDMKAIMACCMFVIVHHTMTSAFVPLYVFGSEGSMHRVLVHAVAVGVFGCITWTIARSFTQLLSCLSDARHASETQAQKLSEQAQELELALRQAETERKDRELFEGKQKAERENEMRRIASEFENSVSSVTRSISQTASILESTIKALNTIAKDTGTSASDVSISADAASSAAGNVARGVAELSASIANIASNVSQQTELTSSATELSSNGGDAVDGLTNRSANIEEATRAIVKIAQRTNLLSLNAAIEASRAGSAGRGFTVVAQEVKALASQASEAAIEINEFLHSMRNGTLEAQYSFDAITSAIAELAESATLIKWDVERQRKSADTIENYARTTANDIVAMAKRSKSLADTAISAQKLSNQLDDAAAQMLENVSSLEQSTSHFMKSLQAG